MAEKYQTPRLSNPFKTWLSYLRRSNTTDVNNNVVVSNIVEDIAPVCRINPSYVRKMFNPHVILEKLPCLERDDCFKVAYHQYNSINELYYYNSTVVTPRSEPFICVNEEASRESAHVWRYSINVRGQAFLRGSSVYNDKYTYTGVKYPDIRPVYK